MKHARLALGALSLFTLVAGCGPGSEVTPVCTRADGVTTPLVPLDIYLMLSQSGSMSTLVSSHASRWSAVTSGLATFAGQASLQGVALGIQYFGLPALGGDSCTAADYATPELEIAPLPSAADALTASLASHSPVASTATSAALQGALDHLNVWGSTHSTHRTIALLVQDHEPTECDTSLAGVEAIAAQAANSTAAIATYVLNVGNPNASLDAIAAAGGTTSAYRADLTSAPQAAVLNQLNQILDDARGCGYVLPLPMQQGAVDYTLVSVTYTPAGGVAQTLGHVAGKSACAAGGGWYFNDETAPSVLALCPGTAHCGAGAGSPFGDLTVYSGCTLQ